MKNGIRYYLYFAPAFILFFVLSGLLNFATEEYICFFTAIAFAGLYCHPDRVSYFENRTSRFNFANAIMSFFVILEKRFPDKAWGRVLTRQLPGFLFFLVVDLVGISIRARVVYLVGVLIFELTYFLYSKSIQKQNDQDDL